MNNLKTRDQLFEGSYDSSWEAGTISVDGIKIPYGLNAWRDNPDIGLTAQLEMNAKIKGLLLQLGIYSKEGFDEQSYPGFAWASKTINPDKYGEEAEDMSDSDIHDALFGKLQNTINKQYTAKTFVKQLSKGDYTWKIVTPEQVEEIKKLMTNNALKDEVLSIPATEILKLARNKEVTSTTESVIKKYIKQMKTNRSEAIEAILIAHEGNDSAGK